MAFFAIHYKDEMNKHIVNTVLQQVIGNLLLVGLCSQISQICYVNVQFHYTGIVFYIGVSGTDKTDNRTSKIIYDIISHVKIFSHFN